MTPESENDQGTEEQETNTENGSGEQRPEGIGHVFLKLFVILLILVGLAGGSVGIVALRRKQILQERNSCFFQKISTGESVRFPTRFMGFSEMQRKPECCRKSRNRTMTGNLPARQKNSPVDGRGTYTAIVELVERASFGPDPLTKNDRTRCYQFYESLEQQFWTQMPKQKRFWWKYMKAYKTS